MKKTIIPLVAALGIFAATAPARAGYWETAQYAGAANSNAAWAWTFASLQLHYAANYGYIDWSLIYQAWTAADAASNLAYEAYWHAPIGSYAEYFSLQAYYNIAAAADNLWVVYLYGGLMPSYGTNAIVDAFWGQHYLSLATVASAGRY